jgi:hypothetical protein
VCYSVPSPGFSPVFERGFCKKNLGQLLCARGQCVYRWECKILSGCSSDHGFCQVFYDRVVGLRVSGTPIFFGFGFVGYVVDLYRVG